MILWPMACQILQRDCRILFRHVLSSSFFLFWNYRHTSWFYDYYHFMSLSKLKTHIKIERENNILKLLNYKSHHFFVRIDEEYMNYFFSLRFPCLLRNNLKGMPKRWGKQLNNEQTKASGLNPMSTWILYLPVSPKSGLQH